MDEFFKIIYRNYAVSERLDEQMNFYDSILQNYKEKCGNEAYGKFENELIICSNECNEFYFVEGMKLAVKIMNGEYIPKI